MVLGPGDELDWEPSPLTPTRKGVRRHEELDFGYDGEVEGHSPSAAKRKAAEGVKLVAKKTGVSLILFDEYRVTRLTERINRLP